MSKIHIKTIIKKDAVIIKRNCTRANFFLAFLILLIFLVMLIFNLNCPIQELTGISCPGCGTTRAYIHLADMDIKGAFHYHPVWFLPLFFPPIWFAYQRKDLSRKQYLTCLTFFSICYIVVYLIRMIWFQGDIVLFEPEQGVIPRLFRFFF